MLTCTNYDGIEFTAWQAEGAAASVEIRRDVLEEIRRCAEEGFKKVGHGGIEHGGILYGTVAEGVARVVEWRQIPCEHARGPSFTLSDKDRAALAQMVEAPSPVLDGLQPLGWWVSHSRSKLALKPQDVELHDRHFAAAHQFVLVLKPAPDAATAAGIFIRDTENQLPPDAPPEPFELTASATALMAAPRPSAYKAPAPPPAPVLAPALPPAPRAEMPAPPAPARPPVEIPTPSFLQPLPAPKSGRFRTFAWIAAFAAAFAAAAFLPDYFESKGASAALRVEEQQDQLFIRWEGHSPALRRADRGALEIHDGGPLQVIALDRDEIHSGTVTYIRRSTDVQVRLTVFRGGKEVMQEFTRYLGPPVAAPRDTAAAPPLDQVEREQLASEIRRLNAALQQEAARTMRLRESAQILETRLRQEDARAATVNP
jgi:hypothetical protein